MFVIYYLSFHSKSGVDKAHCWNPASFDPFISNAELLTQKKENRNKNKTKNVGTL